MAVNSSKKDSAKTAVINDRYEFCAKFFTERPPFTVQTPPPECPSLQHALLLDSHCQWIVKRIDKSTKQSCVQLFLASSYKQQGRDYHFILALDPSTHAYKPFVRRTIY